MPENRLTREHVELLRDVVRHRFHVGEAAIITALEGFKWLLNEESVITKKWLKEYKLGMEGR